jgi:hypothetical protein
MTHTNANANTNGLRHITTVYLNKWTAEYFTHDDWVSEDITPQDHAMHIWRDNGYNTAHTVMHSQIVW